MRALIRRDIDDTVPKCDECKSSPTMRAKYGCDKPAQAEVFHIRCSECNGDPNCEKCGGTRTVSYFRCPGQVFQDHTAIVADLARVVGLYHQYESRHVLPCEGGLLDQPEILMKAFAICGDEHGSIQREESDAREKKKSMDEMTAKVKTMSKNG